jgi:undecaprenyl-diphosphatase
MKLADQFTDRNRLLNILFFLALLILLVIAVCIHIFPENRFDRYVQEKTHHLGSTPLLPFWINLTFLGSFEFLFPAWVIFIGISIWQRKIRFGLSVAGVAIGGFLSMELLKQIFQRHRPPTPLIPNIANYSFPSGHSTSSFIFCAVLTWSLWHSTVPRSVRIAGISFLMILAFFIGLSRIVLTVHYPTDVAAGFCFGTLWSIAWHRFIHKGPGSPKKGKS